jgi:hypothetical protein
MTDDIPTPLFRGEEWLAALLLHMVTEHCGTFSPEKQRAMTSFLSPDPSPDTWLDSYRSAANEDAMRELDAQGYIEIVEEDDHHIVAKVTPEGRALLERLRAALDAKQERR